MPATDPALLSAEDMLAAFARRRLTPVEVLQAVTERVARLNPGAERLRGDEPESPRRGGRERDALARPGGRSVALDGVPVTVKDLVDLAGFPTRRGSRTTSRIRCRTTPLWSPA